MGGQLGGQNSSAQQKGLAGHHHVPAGVLGTVLVVVLVVGGQASSEQSGRVGHIHAPGLLHQQHEGHQSS